MRRSTPENTFFTPHYSALHHTRQTGHKNTKAKLCQTQYSAYTTYHKSEHYYKANSYGNGKGNQVVLQVERQVISYLQGVPTGGVAKDN